MRWNRLIAGALIVLACRMGYADTKISAMSSTSTLNSGDIIPVVTNPSGSAGNFSITKINLSSTLDILTQSSATANFANRANVATATNTLTTNLNTEITNRANGDATIATDTSTIASNLTTEITNRTNGDNTLTTRANAIAVDTGTLQSNFPVSLSTNTMGLLPSSKMGAIGTQVLPSTVAYIVSSQTYSGAPSFISPSGVAITFGMTASSVAVTSMTASGQTVTTGIQVNELTASQPVLSGTTKKLVSGQIDFANTNHVTGTLAAAQEPAHTGDVTNNAGSLAMTAAATQGNVTTFTSSITVRAAFQASTITATQGGANPPVFANAPIQAYGNTNASVQANIQNMSNGGNASSDLTLTSDLGGDTSNFINLGINSSRYNAAGFTVTPTTGAYLYTSDHALAIGAGANGTDSAANIVFWTSAPITSNQRVVIWSTGTVQTFANLVISSGVLVNGAAGNNGQFLTSGGAGTVPSWTTSSASGGGIVSPATFTWVNNFGIQVSTFQAINATGATSFSVSTAATGVAQLATSSIPAVAGTDFLFTVSSVAATMVFGVNNAGNLISSGTTTTVSSCGTSPSVVGNNIAGQITAGGGVVTACTLNFANGGYANPPICTFSDNSTTVNPSLGATSGASVVINLSATLGGGLINYLCWGYQK